MSGGFECGNPTRPEGHFDTGTVYAVGIGIVTFGQYGSEHEAA